MVATFFIGVGHDRVRSRFDENPMALLLRSISSEWWIYLRGPHARPELLQGRMRFG